MRFCSPGQSDTMMMVRGHDVTERKDQAEIRPHNRLLTRSKCDSAGCVGSCDEYWDNNETQPLS